MALLRIRSVSILLLTLAHLVGSFSVYATEPWADSNLKITKGLTLWIDAGRQPEAAAARNRGVLFPGSLIDTLQDGSGNRHDLFQDRRENHPTLIDVSGSLAVDLDGKDDYFRASLGKLNADACTIFLVGSIDGNEGMFRCLFSASRFGYNDYVAGLNLDLGPSASDSFDLLNVEGNGFGGVQNLLKEPQAFGRFQVFELSCESPGGSVTLSLDGVEQNRRPRGNGQISLENFWLGARYYSNSPEPPYVSGFANAKIAELLVYDRALSTDEAREVRQYLMRKYEAARAGLPANSKAHLLKVVESPPVVQMLTNGFQVDELPLKLTNINNLRYRHDGKLVALAYNGDIHLLTDTNGDGLEDKSELFWKNDGHFRGPIGMVLTPDGYPHGNGVIITSKGKLSMIVDNDGDDHGDEEKIITTGWKEIVQSVDALGVTMAPDQSLYFALGTTNYANGYLLDENGVAGFDLNSERGTVLRVSPDWSKRAIVCTGVRFLVAMDFNENGDLFASEQEGATWLPNGNPFDELLHIQPNRHYGFPPRHPKYLPNVIDEPSVFDYRPQHQSTCGMFFNRSIHGGPVFGPSLWKGNAIVCGESRGKLYRTQIAKSPSGYVAKNQLLACLGMLTVDSTVSPKGDLLVACHSGPPDWGTGPEGIGKLFRVRYPEQDLPQPVATWASGEREISIAFDRSIDPMALKESLNKTRVEYGEFVQAGDRFESLKPPYAVVQRHWATPRFELPVHALQLSADQRTIKLSVEPFTSDVDYSLVLPDLVVEKQSRPSRETELPRIPGVDVGFDLRGVSARFRPRDQSFIREIWLPHPDLQLSRSFTEGSAEHAAFWAVLETEGELELSTRLDLTHALQPAVQPGATLDYVPQPERVIVEFESDNLINAEVDGNATAVENGKLIIQRVTTDSSKPIQIKLRLKVASRVPNLHVSFTTAESTTPRPLALRRWHLPWTKETPQLSEAELAKEAARIDEELVSETAHGRWLRGREIYFGARAQCSKCHGIRGLPGGKIGPDLSNLTFRDSASILHDIHEPSAKINPDHISYVALTTDGEVQTGVPLETDEMRIILGRPTGDTIELKRNEITDWKLSTTSTMPKGLLDQLSESEINDLMSFLRYEPLQPTKTVRDDIPPPRSWSEVLTATASSGVWNAPKQLVPAKIVLVAGPKDHGVDEHDYPVWQRRWTRLLGLVEGLTVETADVWPNADQLNTADLIVFYSNNPGWKAERGEELDRYLQRGGGLVFMHWAVAGHDAVDALASRIGLASGKIKFRHGALTLNFTDSTPEITHGFKTLDLVDESYWEMTGDPSQIRVVASAVEEGNPQPLIWTVERGKGRVFVSIMGHYAWTFDDPLYRIILLRGMSWAAHREPDSFESLSTVGARVSPSQGR